MKPIDLISLNVPHLLSENDILFKKFFLYICNAHKQCKRLIQLREDGI